MGDIGFTFQFNIASGRRAGRKIITIQLLEFYLASGRCLDVAIHECQGFFRFKAGARADVGRELLATQVAVDR